MPKRLLHRSSLLAPLFALAVGAFGCGLQTEIQLATSGDHAKLREALALQHRTGAMSLSAARDLSRAVLTHDLATAGEARAGGLIRELAPCSRELEDALRARMAKHDSAGAAAALASIEAGILDPARWTPPEDDSPAWRAVRARTLVSAESSERRRALYLDPLPEVRRSAIRASPVHDLAEVAALTELAAKDPEPLLRTEAVRALGRAAPGLSAVVVDKLRDLWIWADGPLRGTIAGVLAMRPFLGAGGAAPLVHWMGGSEPKGRLDAATALMFAKGPWSGLAFEQLLFAASGADQVWRLRALSILPLDEPQNRARAVQAFRLATAGDDTALQIAGWSRLAEIPESNAEATASLVALASPGRPTSERAQFALASLGDRRVQAWLESGLTGGEMQKGAALFGLIALGLPTRATPLLADTDERVRDRAACMILSASRRKSAR